MAYKQDFEKAKLKLKKERKSLLFSITELENLRLDTTREHKQLKRIEKLINIYEILLFNNDKRLISWKNSDLQAYKMTNDIKRTFGFYGLLPIYHTEWEKINKRLDRLGL